MTNIPTPDPDDIQDPDLRAVVVALNLATDALVHVAGKVQTTRVWLAVLAVVVLLLPVSYSVQRRADCHQTNRYREDIQAGIVTVIRGFGDTPEVTRAADKAEVILRRTFPRSDCGGLFP